MKIYLTRTHKTTEKCLKSTIRILIFDSYYHELCEVIRIRIPYPKYPVIFKELEIEQGLFDLLESEDQQTLDVGVELLKNLLLNEYKIKS